MARKRTASTRGQAKALRELRARVEYAKSFGEWASGAPGTQTVAAKTHLDAINEILGELARIMACFNFQNALDKIQDHGVLYGDREAYLDDATEEIKEGMAALNCRSVLSQ